MINFPKLWIIDDEKKKRKIIVEQSIQYKRIYVFIRIDDSGWSDNGVLFFRRQSVRGDNDSSF